MHKQTWWAALQLVGSLPAKTVYPSSRICIQPVTRFRSLFQFGRRYFRWTHGLVGSGSFAFTLVDNPRPWTQCALKQSLDTVSRTR
jgi:hypothetical protein